MAEHDNEATLSFSTEHWNDFAESMIHDGYEVAAKLKSTESGLYVIHMENACTIRKNWRMHAPSGKIRRLFIAVCYPWQPKV